MVKTAAALSDVDDKVLASLPRLTETDLLPEINSLIIDENGRLLPKEASGAYSVSFHRGPHVITLEVDGQPSGKVTLRVGCALEALPFTAESADKRRAFFRRVHQARLTGLGKLGVTPKSRLYLYDTLVFEGQKVTASWLVAHIAMIVIYLTPVMEMFHAQPARA